MSFRWTIGWGYMRLNHYRRGDPAAAAPKRSRTYIEPQILPVSHMAL